MAEEASGELGKEINVFVTVGIPQPRTFAAYLHAQRWNCVTSTRPRLFQAPHRAGIELLAYQLEPLRKALLLPFGSALARAVLATQAAGGQRWRAPGSSFREPAA